MAANENIADKAVNEIIYVDKRTKNLTILAVLAMSMVQLSAMNVAAGLAVIREAYAAEGYGITAIQMIQTLPTLFVLVGAFGTAFLCKYTGTKLAMLLGLALIGIAGSLPAMILSYPVMLTTCAVKGIGLGIVSNLGAGGIFTRMFSEAPHTKAKVMSWQALAKYIGGMIMPICAGYLAAIAWNNIFYVNLLTVPCFIVVLFAMPKDYLVYPQEYTKEAIADKAEKETAADLTPHADKWKLPPSVWMTALIGLIWMTFFNAMVPNLAMRIASVGGDPVAAGYASTLYTWSSFVIIMAFVYLNKWFKRALWPIGFCFCAIAMIGLGWFTDSITACMVFTAFGGVGVGIVSVSSNIEVTLFAPNISKLMAMAVNTTAVNVGMFISPFILGALSLAMFGSDESAYRYMVAACVLIPLSILVLIRQYYLMAKKKEWLFAKETTDVKY